MMKFDADDPRLTAFALGELDPDEAAPIERALSESPSLQREIDQIRAMAGSLRAQLSVEASPRLTPAQRETIAQEPKSVLNSPLIFRRTSRWIAAGAALAACVALAITAAIMFNNQVDSDDRVAIQQPTPGKTKSKAEKDLDGDSGLMAQAPERAPGGLKLPSTAVADPQAETEHRALLEGRSQASEARSRVARPGAGTEAPAAADKLGAPGDSSAAPSRRSSQSPPPPPAPPPGPPQSAGGMRQVDPMEVAAPGMDTGGFSGGSPHVDGLLRDGRVAGQPNIANEGLAFIEDNPFQRTIEDPKSTFSIDVDTASYSNVRRFINQGTLPPRDAVRVEELVNYFNYSYEPPSAAEGDAPFSANVEVNVAPWNAEHRLVRIGLKGKEIKLDMRPATSLVFLIDVSGSMRDDNKLPLVKESLKLLIDQLNGDDRLAIVTYAGEAGLVLDSMYVSRQNRPQIDEAINALQAGGSTNGAGGIQIAYDVAAKHFIKGGVNRVILCTDGDFNVGVASNSELVQMIQEKRSTGVFLSVLGFGQGNFKEDKMQELAKHGNGNFAYIDSIDEGRRVLVEQMGATLITIAKDVKIQVHFNPKKVGSYRLIGFENRMLEAQDFRDDKKDAGEIGSGHSVTALYEIAPPSADKDGDAQTAPQSDFIGAAPIVESELLMNLKVSYKQPDADQSSELSFPIADDNGTWNGASADFKFASAVAAFGMVLRESPYKGDANLASVLTWAREANTALELTKTATFEELKDQPDYRAEFIELVEQAKAISGRE